MLIALLIAAGAPAAQAALPAVERAAIFKAAGFAPTRGRYVACDRTSALELETRDINGDGRPDAVVTDQGLECYGRDEMGFVLLTRSPAGAWTKLYQSPGVATFLKTSANGWPDLEVGGPGFCFPVLRWTGKTYALARHQYEGKPCRP